MTHQTKAQRLADALDAIDDGYSATPRLAAAELRRLYDLLGKSNALCRIRAQRIEELEVANKQLLEALEALEQYSDGIICYASTMGEHEPNLIAFKARAAIAAAKEEA